MSALGEAKQRSIPIDAIDIENNFWIHDPPSEEDMTSKLAAIKALGYKIATPETTVCVSSVFPTWQSRPKVLADGEGSATGAGGYL